LTARHPTKVRPYMPYDKKDVTVPYGVNEQPISALDIFFFLLTTRQRYEYDSSLPYYRDAAARVGFVRAARTVLYGNSTVVRLFDHEQ
jgi:hypothetical protein